MSLHVIDLIPVSMYVFLATEEATEQTNKYILNI